MNATLKSALAAWHDLAEAKGHAAARGQPPVDAASDVLAAMSDVAAAPLEKEQMKGAMSSHIATVATSREVEAASRHRTACLHGAGGSMRAMRHVAAVTRWRLWCAAMVIALAPTGSWSQAAVADVADEVLAESNPIWGKRTSRSECEATRYAVWVVHAQGEACIRYFPSSDVDGAKTAAFFFHGDVSSGRSAAQGESRVTTAGALLKDSKNLARVNAMPYIFVARPGVFGSSGLHRERGKLEEHLALNAAVDAIKARHGIERVHLGGQGGGATAVGALLTLGRSDVVCAAAASGGFNPQRRAQDITRQRGAYWSGCNGRGGCDNYNVTDHVAGIVASPTRRIFLVGDPRDTDAAFVYQQEFAVKIALADLSGANDLSGS